MQGEWLDIPPFSLPWFRLTYDRHYVAVIRKSLSGQSGLSWVMFNDEKVVKFEDIEAMKKSAYLYFFTRV
jgi:uncharacterized UBP type Zn finger protein